MNILKMLPVLFAAVCCFGAEEYSRFQMEMMPELVLDRQWNIRTDVKILRWQPDLAGISERREPTLEELTIDSCGPGNPGEVERFLGGLISLKELRMIGLGMAMELSSLEGRTAYRSIGAESFEFSSLSRLKLEALTLWGFDGTSLEFLRGMPLKRLTLSIQQPLPPGAWEVLGTLPLEELTLVARSKGTDLGFLTNLKLKKLNLHIAGTDSCSPDLLKDMPLESLRLLGFVGLEGDWRILEKMPLKELVLNKCALNDPGFLKNLPLENLTLQECYWTNETVLDAVSRISTLKNFFFGANFLYREGQREVLLNEKLSWDAIRNPGLTYLAFFGPGDFTFCRNLKSLKCLKVLDLIGPGNPDLSTFEWGNIECLIAGKRGWKPEITLPAGKRILPRTAIFFLEDNPDNLHLYLMRRSWN